MEVPLRQTHRDRSRHASHERATGADEIRIRSCGFEHLKCKDFFHSFYTPHAHTETHTRCLSFAHTCRCHHAHLQAASPIDWTRVPETHHEEVDELRVSQAGTHTHTHTVCTSQSAQPPSAARLMPSFPSSAARLMPPFPCPPCHASVMRRLAVAPVSALICIRSSAILHPRLHMVRPWATAGALSRAHPPLTVHVHHSLVRSSRAAQRWRPRPAPTAESTLIRSSPRLSRPTHTSMSDSRSSVRHSALARLLLVSVLAAACASTPSLGRRLR